MGFFSQFTRRKNDPDLDLERARALVSVANIAAISQFVPLLDHCPALRQVKPEQWDFIGTIAGVFVAVTRLHTNDHIEEGRKVHMMEVIQSEMIKYDADALRAFIDCKKLFEQVHTRLTDAGENPRFIGTDSLGNWIVLNLLGQLPEREIGGQLIRVAGGIVVHNLSEYWVKQ